MLVLVHIQTLSIRKERKKGREGGERGEREGREERGERGRETFDDEKGASHILRWREGKRI